MIKIRYPCGPSRNDADYGTVKEGGIMESAEERKAESKQQAAGILHDGCPALIFAKRPLCEAFDRLYYPSSREVNECCMRENYINCFLDNTLQSGAV